VVLLSTDEEIDAALYDNLSRFVRHTYLLDHNTTAGTTEIVSGYWWSKGSPNAA
jgi:DNA sulfur modification protein DndD